MGITEVLIRQRLTSPVPTPSLWSKQHSSGAMARLAVPTHTARFTKLGCLPCFGLLALVAGFFVTYIQWSLGFDIELQAVYMDSFACGKAVRDGTCTADDAAADFFATCSSTLKLEDPNDCLGAWSGGVSKQLLEGSDPGKFNKLGNNLKKNFYSKYFAANTIAKPVFLPGLTVSDPESDDAVYSHYWMAMPYIGARSNGSAANFWQPACNDKADCTADCSCPEDSSACNSTCGSDLMVYDDACDSNCSRAPGHASYIVKGNGLNGFFGRTPFSAPAAFPSSGSGSCPACKFVADQDKVTAALLRIWVSFSFVGVEFSNSCSGDGCNEYDRRMESKSVYLNNSGPLFYGADGTAGEQTIFGGRTEARQGCESDPDRECRCPADTPTGESEREDREASESTKVSLNTIMGLISTCMVAWVSIAMAIVGPILHLTDDNKDARTSCRGGPCCPRPCKSTPCSAVCAMPLVVINLLLITLVSSAIASAPQAYYPVILWVFYPEEYGVIPPGQKLPLPKSMPPVYHFPDQCGAVHEDAEEPETVPHGRFVTELIDEQYGVPSLSRFQLRWVEDNYNAVKGFIRDTFGDIAWIGKEPWDMLALFYMLTQIPGLLRIPIKDGAIDAQYLQSEYADWPNPICPAMGKSMVGASSKITNTHATAGTNASIPMSMIALVFTFLLCIVLILRPGDRQRRGEIVSGAAVAMTDDSPKAPAHAATTVSEKSIGSSSAALSDSL